MTTETITAIKKIQNLENIYVAFSASTKLPYVKCDPESFDDQAYLFDSKEAADAFAAENTRKKYPVNAAPFRKEDTLKALTNLYYIGVNRIAFYSDMNYVYIPLEDIVTFHAPEQDEKKPPVMNPTLLLTMIYFLQEARRPEADPQDQDRLKKLQELEEEMLSNFSRSKVTVAFAAPAKDAPADEEPGKSKAVILKAQDGKIFQPLFTDMWECQRFVNTQKINCRLVTVPFSEVKKLLVPESAGFLVNPTDVSLLLRKERFK